MNKSKARRTSADKKRIIEGVKSAAIAVLIITAALMMPEVGILYRDGANPLQAMTSGAPTEGNYIAASAPVSVVITPENGAHCALVHGDARITVAYERFSGALGEALSLADAPRVISEAEWQTALSGRGVCFDFYSEIPLSAISSWLETSTPESLADYAARRICLAQEGENVVLFFSRGEEYFCAPTLLEYSSIFERTMEYIPNGASYNFERETPFENVDLEFVITRDQPEASGVSSRNPVGLGVDEELVLSAFPMNSFVAQKSELEGLTVFVEGESSLRIERDGHVVYSENSVRMERSAAETDANRAIEAARDLASGTVGVYSGHAGIFLSSFLYEPLSGQYTIQFEYELGGLPIIAVDGTPAAEIVIEDGRVIYAELLIREYTAADTNEKPLPALQAAAAVQASGGGEPLLCYSDNGDSVLAGWIIR